MTRAFAGLIVMLAAPFACGGQDLIRDRCDDGGACVSDAACPEEPPNTGTLCPSGMADNAVCFYCTEGERLDATQFECEGQRFQRRDNTDCE
jgi:hypothetical protein